MIIRVIDQWCKNFWKMEWTIVLSFHFIVAFPAETWIFGVIILKYSTVTIGLIVDMESKRKKTSLDQLFICLSVRMAVPCLTNNRNSTVIWKIFKITEKLMKFRFFICKIYEFIMDWMCIYKLLTLSITIFHV